MSYIITSILLFTVLNLCFMHHSQKFIKSQTSHRSNYNAFHNTIIPLQFFYLFQYFFGFRQTYHSTFPFIEFIKKRQQFLELQTSLHLVQFNLLYIHYKMLKIIYKLSKAKITLTDNNYHIAVLESKLIGSPVLRQIRQEFPFFKNITTLCTIIEDKKQELNKFVALNYTSYTIQSSPFLQPILILNKQIITSFGGYLNKWNNIIQLPQLTYLQGYMNIIHPNVYHKILVSLIQNIQLLNYVDRKNILNNLSYLSFEKYSTQVKKIPRIYDLIEILYSRLPKLTNFDHQELFILDNLLSKDTITRGKSSYYTLVNKKDNPANLLLLAIQQGNDIRSLLDLYQNEILSLSPSSKLCDLLLQSYIQIGNINLRIYKTFIKPFLKQKSQLSENLIIILEQLILIDCKDNQFIQQILLKISSTPLRELRNTKVLHRITHYMKTVLNWPLSAKLEKQLCEICAITHSRHFHEAVNKLQGEQIRKSDCIGLIGEINQSQRAPFKFSNHPDTFEEKTIYKILKSSHYNVQSKPHFCTYEVDVILQHNNKLIAIEIHGIQYKLISGRFRRHFQLKLDLLRYYSFKVVLIDINEPEFKSSISQYTRNSNSNPLLNYLVKKISQ